VRGIKEAARTNKTSGADEIIASGLVNFGRPRSITSLRTIIPSRRTAGRNPTGGAIVAFTYMDAIPSYRGEEECKRRSVTADWHHRHTRPLHAALRSRRGVLTGLVKWDTLS